MMEGSWKLDRDDQRHPSPPHMQARPASCSCLMSMSLSLHNPPPPQKQHENTPTLSGLLLFVLHCFFSSSTASMLISVSLFLSRVAAALLPGSASSHSLVPLSCSYERGRLAKRSHKALTYSAIVASTSPSFSLLIPLQGNENMTSCGF